MSLNFFLNLDIHNVKLVVHSHTLALSSHTQVLDDFSFSSGYEYKFFFFFFCSYTSALRHWLCPTLGGKLLLPNVDDALD